MGLADYSNYAFDAVRHVGSCILDCVDTEKGVQRWKYIKYIAFKGKVNDKKVGVANIFFFANFTQKSL